MLVLKNALGILFLALLAPEWVHATPGDAPGNGEVKRFIGCPVYRDTDSGRKSGCWLVTDTQSGLRFDLQQAFTKPQLGQEILVEGYLPESAKRSVADCGGWVLERVRVSVLPGSCPATWLPAEDFPGRRFEVPASAMTPNHLPQPQPPQPWVTREFQIFFDFGNDYLRYQHAEVILQEAVRLAQLGGARNIRITGYAATAPVDVSGRRLREPLSLAKARTQMTTEALVRLGWPRSKIIARSDTHPVSLPDVPAEHVQASLRRVTLLVVIGNERKVKTGRSIQKPH